MTAYIVAHAEITNPAKYEDYKKLSTQAMAIYGAEVCARGGKVEVLEGDWNPPRLVVLKFPSVEAAKRYYDSPEYSQARAARDGAATMRMVIVEGVD